MTMGTESITNQSRDQEMNVDYDLDDIISSLTYNHEICFKNQQKWEADLTCKEKFDIAMQLFETSKLNFLLKFGKHLKHDQLDYFNQFTENCEPDWEEVKLVLNELRKNCSSNYHNTIIKNRRYEALKKMIKDDTYFSEIEMMKRNPLLYEQLVGQYMSEEEVKARDKYKMDEQCTFVKILMEGIERDNAEAFKKRQEEYEGNQMKEEDASDDDGEGQKQPSSPQPCTSRWGEFEQSEPKRMKPPHKQNLSITAEERLLLQQEFVTTMYHSFLEGNDENFDYTVVDSDASYDNLVELDHDEEDKYFESEEADENMDKYNDVSSEDELDMYMSALNQHPSVTQLSKDLTRL